MFPFWILRGLHENQGNFQLNILQIREHMSAGHAKSWYVDE